MNGSDLAIELPPIGTGALEALRGRLVARLGERWGSPAVRLIIESEAGRDLADVVIANRDGVLRQIADATAQRAGEVSVRLWIPRSCAAGALDAAAALVEAAGLEGEDRSTVLDLLAAARAVAAEGEEIRFPAKPPQDMLAMVEFWREMDRRMRELRETTALPRAAVTLPDEFDDIVAELWDLTYRQATEAIERGDELVEVRVPRSEKLRALASWASERMDLLEGLVRAGMVQNEWERPLKIIVEMFQSVVTQLAV